MILNKGQVDMQNLDRDFPLRSVIKWDIAKEEVPHNWQSDFWRAFGCGELWGYDAGSFVNLEFLRKRV